LGEEAVASKQDAANDEDFLVAREHSGVDEFDVDVNDTLVDVRVRRTAIVTATKILCKLFEGSFVDVPILDGKTTPVELIGYAPTNHLGEVSFDSLLDPFEVTMGF
jgi:hypothetical protein